MNKYKIVYQTRSGYKNTEYIYAANRIAALEMFEKHECFKDVVGADCFRVLDDEDDG